MEKRMEIINNLMQEIIENVINPDKIIFDNNYKNDLKKFPNYFTKSEMLECDKKLELLEYILPMDKNVSKEKWFKENLDVLTFFLKDIKGFFKTLKNKRKKLLEEIFNECVVSMGNFGSFCRFVGTSEFYFENYRHYFSEKEIEEYNRLWLDLEIENAVILANNEKKWEENYCLILRGLQEMLVFLDKIS